MKKEIWSVILILCISLTLSSCVEEPPFFECGLWACNEKLALDILEVENALIGDWEWEYVFCVSGVDLDYDGIQIEFKSDKTLTMSEDEKVTETSTWSVADGEPGFFRIGTSPRLFQIEGRILFCDESLVFANSIRDGCDIYFKRR